MELYKIRFTVNARAVQRITTMDVILEGDDKYSEDGDWSGADKTSSDLFDIWFGDTEGYWERKAPSERGTGNLYLYNHDSPNFVSQLWRTPMEWVATLVAPGKWPLSLGDSWAAYQNLYSRIDCMWKVIHRNF